MIGSSPLARGAHEGLLTASSSIRLIPAGAGSTSRPRYGGEQYTAHPRWRGEHDCRTVTTAYDYGSSPLARGARRRSFGVPFSLRLIPAPAGMSP